MKVPSLTSKSTSSPSQIVAAFDFDGTITTSDSLRHFLLYLLGSKRFILTAIRSLPTLIAFKLGFIHNEEAKVRILNRVIRGWTREKLEAEGKKFAEQKLNQICRPNALDKIRWHQEQGHTLVLVSASVETYLQPWCNVMGFDKCCCTRLEFVDGKATGNLSGKNCWGAEKAARLKEVFGDLGAIELYAYGDTRGDREMLEAATHSFYRTF
jgi:phosphatidylglycerophosphatase C